ncbi:hypothetical protein KM176_20865 [Pseudooceanicola sp. CBS1P-1]|uniref:Uncharacterized protein n=1 Tax=Pseudooceanicola albus TaxID=2692189 RepID=A0A6L7GEJ8_9RHOB|nr:MULTISPECIES: hypothetical protein [Pseudooceanicola]MBT9386334.1 hypothetical protein [Pseudooceanicola endophyticus]MXN21173.1 hypothetical protein [Pseudooceanicola albus]
MQGDPCGVLWRMGEIGALDQILRDESLTNLLAENRMSACTEALNTIFQDARLRHLPDASELSVLNSPEAADLRNLPLETLKPSRYTFMQERVIDVTPDGVVIGRNDPFVKPPLKNLSDAPAALTIPFSDLAILKSPDGRLYPILPTAPDHDMSTVASVNPGSDSWHSFGSDSDPKAMSSEFYLRLRGVRASRLFSPMTKLKMKEYAGVGIVAFPRAPDGSLVKRATLLCEAFSLAMETVEFGSDRSFGPDKQVATIWPITPKATIAEHYGNGTPGGDDDISCAEAIERYDWREGSSALQQAADFYLSRGKNDVAERVGAADLDGPWLLAWAPGENKGSSADDVLVLAYDLSNVETELQAERVFQSWRITIERNADLWLKPQIANEHWTSAFVRFVNMLGANSDFYKLMIKG